MNFIKFGNHVIAPAGAEPTPAATAPPSDPVTEVLSLARLLQAKLTDLEMSVAERKARRQEWRAGVSRLDKMLVALKEQDSKEGDKLAKLAKRWNKTRLTVHHHDAPRYMFGAPRDRDYARDERFICPTTQAASAFNGNTERYRDSYTFSGPASKPTPALAYSAASQPFSFSSPPSSPAGYRMNQDSFKFQFTASPESLDHTRRETESYSAGTTPTKGGDQIQTQHAGHRAALSDIQNTPQDQDAGEGRGRKRRTVDFEADEYDGPYKRTRGAETRRYNSDRRVGRRDSRRSTETEY
ncbi:hypothetical protein B0H17DRAFT_1211840 [Mycena rosella]|uniref:Uncharacterized protein n=1 Tax=Mycena rosella TaxID=1033263 RepID=A0AAD7CT56_MYCRO|nr:hypothetical protein B0H17DRAFT_1211840 [Mycena rosella]